MKTLIILLTLATATFGATLGFQSPFLGLNDYPNGPLTSDPFVGHDRRTRDTDEDFSDILKGYDKNGDRKVSASEMREFHQSKGTGETETREAVNHMITFDNDLDGELSAEEFCHWFHSPLPYHSFQGYDTNSDRTFSASEIKEFNRDKGVSESETKESVSKINSFDGDGNKVLDETEFRSWFSSSYLSEESTLAATFRSYDKDGDKKVSSSEIRMVYDDEGPCGSGIVGLGSLEARKAVFRVMAFDENGDGELDEDEFGSWYNGDGFDLAWKKYFLKGEVGNIG